VEVNGVSWFQESFGEEYRLLYQHRDESEAQTMANLIRSRAATGWCGPALDVACGAGRHLRYLKGYSWVVGIDLSAPLLRVARSTNHHAFLVQADMRALPFRSGVFTLVVNLFTSFGYFSDDAQNRSALDEIARVTAPSGWFVLDFFNAVHIRERLVRFDRQQVGSLVVEQHREISIDGRYVQKAIAIIGADRTFYERVRLFELNDLLLMMQSCRFEVREVLGDYSGGPITADSPRTILIAQRS